MRKLKVWSGFVMVAVLAGLVAGCSTQARRVGCEGRLRAINAPAPVIAPTAAPPKSGQTP